MKIPQLIGMSDIVIRDHATSKKQILQDMVSIIARQKRAIDERHVMDCLIEREKLGSTGIGGGVAIPHARCAFPTPLPHQNPDMVGLLMKLNAPVDFQANDGAPVDILFMLIASEACGSAHLTTLAGISRFIRDETTAHHIRQATTPEMIWQQLAQLQSAA